MIKQEKNYFILKDFFQPFFNDFDNIIRQFLEYY